MNEYLGDLSRKLAESNPIPFVTAYRFTSENIPMPEKNSPYIYIVADGSIRLHTPSGIMDYMAGQYSISAIDTPFYGEVLCFSEIGDFTSLAVEISVSEIISVMLEIDGDLTDKILGSKLSERMLSRSDEKVIHSVIRLLELSAEPEFFGFMANQIRREIIFYALCGSCGNRLIQSVINIAGASDIYKINNWIKKNYKTAFSVEELAQNNHMSVSNFHQKFKSAIGMGPLQCQKRLRLTEARRLMLNENISVTAAALEVGYESLSQFIRDYKKCFSPRPRKIYKC